MEYRFSLTPRLIALAIFSGVAMLVLLFALGYQVGVSMAERPAPDAIDNAAKRTPPGGGQDQRRGGGPPPARRPARCRPRKRLRNE
ncbi:hypothetical protein [Duganella sp. BJB1802]|uniref:hypothetical protein n=1 Tax=Duganella sp. BJB1802 TaxID=2744575 RepID=UPI001E2A3B7F|nr:hypothetical protein [Duganella sp. BJB1802]